RPSESLTSASRANPGSVLGWPPRKMPSTRAIGIRATRIPRAPGLRLARMSRPHGTARKSGLCKRQLEPHARAGVDVRRPARRELRREVQAPPSIRVRRALGRLEAWAGVEHLDPQYTIRESHAHLQVSLLLDVLDRVGDALRSQ